MTIPQLAPDEPLSPELVLVLPPECRAQALAALGPPVWPTPRLRVYVPSAPVQEPVGHALGRLLAGRVASLALIFVVATVLTLVLAQVAHALH